MIQRNGFVSNSSSSSFVLIVPMSAHMQAMNKLTDFERAVVNFAMKPAGNVVPTIMYCHDLSIMDESQLFGEYSTFEYEDWPEDDEGERIPWWAVLEKYKEMTRGFESTLYDG